MLMDRKWCKSWQEAMALQVLEDLFGPVFLFWLFADIGVSVSDLQLVFFGMVLKYLVFSAVLMM